MSEENCNVGQTTPTKTPEDKLLTVLQKFSDEVHDLAFHVQDNSDQGEYNEFLKLLKLLQGCSLFNTIVRSTSKEYVRRFGGESQGKPEGEE